MEEKVIRTVEKAVTEEKSVLEQLKEKTTDLMTQLKKFTTKLLKDNMDDEDDDQVYYMKKFKKMMNSCEEITSLSFDYMAEADKTISDCKEQLMELAKKESEQIELTKETNKLLKEILKQEGNNCTVLGRIAEKK